MNIKHNPPRRTALVWTGVILIGIIIIALPGLAGINGLRGGTALSFLGGFLALVGLISSFIYFSLARSLDRITHPSNILAHWRYSPAEWSTFINDEKKEGGLSRRFLFILIAVISVLVGLIFWAFVRENPLLIALIVLVIVAVAGLTVWINARIEKRTDRDNPGEVYIARDGAYLNRQLHVWKGPGIKLYEIVFESENQAVPRIRIEYTVPSREGALSYTVHIPVPSEQFETADRLVKEIAAAHLK